MKYLLNYVFLFFPWYLLIIFFIYNFNKFSVRINERNVDCEIKKIAYLVDLQTIYVLDLISGITVATVNHDCRIDWLEVLIYWIYSYIYNI